MCCRNLRSVPNRITTVLKPQVELQNPQTVADLIGLSDENGNPWSPGWFTLNMKLSYEMMNRVSVTGGIENMFNVRYRPYSSGIVSPGRNFIISLRLAL
jgi:outer membrane receptor protein involved in Fe transport